MSFTATGPRPHVYRLFMDFKYDGDVRTANFTVQAGPDGGAGDDQAGEGDAGHDESTCSSGREHE